MTKDKLLDQLPADFFQKDGFARLTNLRIEEAGEDTLTVAMDIRPEILNIHGIVLGGALYTLADDCAGLLCLSDGRAWVTLDGNLHFMANQSEGPIRARGRVRRRGKTTCLVSVDVLGTDDRLLACGDFNFYCITKPTGETK